MDLNITEHSHTSLNDAFRRVQIVIVLLVLAHRVSATDYPIFNLYIASLLRGQKVEYVILPRWEQQNNIAVGRRLHAYFKVDEQLLSLLSGNHIVLGDGNKPWKYHGNANNCRRKRISTLIYELRRHAVHAVTVRVVVQVTNAVTHDRQAGQGTATLNLHIRNTRTCSLRVCRNNIVQLRRQFQTGGSMHCQMEDDEHKLQLLFPGGQVHRVFADVSQQGAHYPLDNGGEIRKRQANIFKNTMSRRASAKHEGRFRSLLRTRHRAHTGHVDTARVARVTSRTHRVSFRLHPHAIGSSATGGSSRGWVHSW